MPTIQERTGKKGTTYRAIIRRRGLRPITATFSREKAAADWATKTEAAILEHRYSDPRDLRITLGAAIEQYMEDVSPKKAASTHRREKDTAGILLRELGPLTMLPDITGPVVARYRDLRLKTVSAYSVRQELALLSHLFTILKTEWGVPLDNPVRAIKRPPEPQGRIKFLDRAESKALLDECRKSRNPNLYAYILLMLQTGMRPGEAAALRHSQVGLAQRQIMLERTKSGKRRRIPLTKEAQAAIEAIIKRQQKQTKKKKVVPLASHDTLVFLEHRADKMAGESQHSRHLRESFQNARDRAKLDPGLHLHDLRHTAASHLIMAGVDLRTVAEVLGHNTLRMVMRYTHLLDSHVRTAIDKLDGLGTT